MNGIIDVGGGLRGIFGAGIFDRCLDDNISFDVCVGVSAGSANIASFIAKQRGRNYPFYTEYSSRKEYMSIQNMMKKGAYLDLEYIYGELSRENGENPLDYNAFFDYKGKLFVVASDGVTGKVHYFTKDDFRLDDLTPLIASSTLPVFCDACKLGDRYFYDGGLADPVPIEKAFSEGCDKVVLILTRPIDFVLPTTRDRTGAAALKRKYPGAAKLLRQRKALYDEEIKIAKDYAAEGKCLILAPDKETTDGIGTLTKDREKLDALYKNGYEEAAKIKKFLEEPIKKEA
ncbi:MAG: patatin family protein [Acutalibacteraceae bacterium]